MIFQILQTPLYNFSHLLFSLLTHLEILKFLFAALSLLIEPDVIHYSYFLDLQTTASPPLKHQNLKHLSAKHQLLSPPAQLLLLLSLLFPPSPAPLPPLSFPFRSIFPDPSGVVSSALYKKDHRKGKERGGNGAGDGGK